MRQNIWCFLVLSVCLAAVLVKSESFTEVDEDGNEIEVKRFYIEGRQLNGGQRQCVETRRRKRAYNYGQSDDSANDELPISSGTAATGIDTAAAIDEEDHEEAEKDEEALGLNNDTNDANGEQIMAEHKGQPMDEKDSDKKEVEPLLSLPVIAHITQPNVEQSSVGAAGSGNNGIVIIHTNKPPKVNPQTHAVFELRPVQNDENANEDNDSDDYDEDVNYDNLNLGYLEEISPVSTTAIWSTGEDDLGNLHDDYKDDNNNDNNEESGEDVAAAKPKRKPPKKKPSKRPTKRPGKRPSKNKNKKTSKYRRPSNKNKSGKRGNNKRRRQRPQNGPHRKPNLTNSRRGQLNNLHAHNQGTHTFTKTDSYTRTGTGNDDRDVNCIIINRTATPRPFWGLFGRNADGGAMALAERPYGRRKRINFSLPA
ncbi:myb-like protein V [Eurosta solidaginis]|uniref:myb-like protein V n=1 Tax=Eurosta solidaginis TaxID=178769 RepID=UPI0035316C23